MSCPWKVAIFGAGGTGGAIAEILTRHSYREVALIDIDADLAAGKAFDIEQSCALVGSDTKVVSGDDVALAEDADVVVITAGIGRRPGVTRESLVSTNGKIMQDIARGIRLFAARAFVIVLSNPADILARIVLAKTGFPSSRVMAQGGILDSARLIYWISRLVSVSPIDVRAMVLGGHGDHMVPVQSLTSINGIPAGHLMTNDQWHTAVEHTRYGGGEILAKFKTHGAAVTPGYAVVRIIEALQAEHAHILPLSVRSAGRYDLPEDVFIGLPVRISKRGVDDILTVPLPDTSLQSLRRSAETMDDAYQKWATDQSS